MSIEEAYSDVVSHPGDEFTQEKLKSIGQYLNAQIQDYKTTKKSKLHPAKASFISTMESKLQEFNESVDYMDDTSPRLMLHKINELSVISAELMVLGHGYFHKTFGPTRLTWRGLKPLDQRKKGFLCFKGSDLCQALKNFDAFIDATETKFKNKMQAQSLLATEEQLVPEGLNQAPLKPDLPKSLSLPVAPSAKNPEPPQQPLSIKSVQLPDDNFSPANRTALTDPSIAIPQVNPKKPKSLDEYVQEINFLLNTQAPIKHIKKTYAQAVFAHLPKLKTNTLFASPKALTAEKEAFYKKLINLLDGHLSTFSSPTDILFDEEFAHAEQVAEFAAEQCLEYAHATQDKNLKKDWEDKAVSFTGTAKNSVLQQIKSNRLCNKQFEEYVDYLETEFMQENHEKIAASLKDTGLVWETHEKISDSNTEKSNRSNESNEAAIKKALTPDTESSLINLLTEFLGNIFRTFKPHWVTESLHCLQRPTALLVTNRSTCTDSELKEEHVHVQYYQRKAAHKAHCIYQCLEQGNWQKAKMLFDNLNSNVINRNLTLEIFGEISKKYKTPDGQEVSLGDMLVTQMLDHYSKEYADPRAFYALIHPNVENQFYGDELYQRTKHCQNITYLVGKHDQDKFEVTWDTFKNSYNVSNTAALRR